MCDGPLIRINGPAGSVLSLAVSMFIKILRSCPGKVPLKNCHLTGFYRIHKDCIYYSYGLSAGNMAYNRSKTALSAVFWNGIFLVNKIGIFAHGRGSAGSQAMLPLYLCRASGQKTDFLMGR